MKTSPNILAHSLLRRISLTAIFAASLPGLLEAASYNSTWDGGGDGVSWSDVGNWNTANYPQNGSDFYHAWIDHGAGDLLVTTSGSITTRGLTLTQGAGGSTTLKLGGNYDISDGTLAAGSGVYNTSGSAGGVVFDLNGYSLTTTSLNTINHNFGAGSYTLKSSHADGSGIFAVRNIAAGAVIDVQNNVTVRLTVATPSNFTLTTWSEGSTLQLVATGGGSTAGATSAVALGNLIVGDRSNNAASTFSINNTNITVRGDVTLETYSGATGGAASRLSFSSATQSLRVGGNFTDYGTDDNHYGSNTSATGTIFFVGGTSVEKVVSIGRTGLRNAFQVGDASADGNIALGQNLKTTGGVVVQDDSRFSVGEFTLQSGAFTAEAGATLGFELGGVIDTTTLTLNSFNLELLGDWSSYDSGNDVLLFTYTTLVGTPILESFTGPEGFSFGEIYISNGGVYLEMDVIPEPGTWALLGIAGVVLARHIRRRA